MADVDILSSKVKQIIREYGKLQPAGPGELHRESVCDDEQRSYLLVTSGWDQQKRRVHHVPVHLQVRDGKVWVLCDQQLPSILDDLEAAGIAKSDIVLAHRRPETQANLGYAVA